MPQHRGFKAWLQCGDDVLEEHAVGQDPRDERVYTCWVPSEVGKTFTIHWRSYENNFRHLGSTTIDGVKSGNCLSGKAPTGRKLGMRVNDHEIRPFMFSEIKLTDDDSATQHASNAVDIGTIKLELRFVNVQRRVRGSVGTCTSHMLQDQAVHEKAKKLGGHRVVLGDAVKTDYQKVSHHYTPVDPEDGGFRVLFKFMYRSRDAAFLMAQGIIPPTVSESRSPSVQQSARATRKRKRKADEQSTIIANEGVPDSISSSTRRQSKIRHPSVKEEDVDGGLLQNATDDDALNVLDQQLRVMQEQIARLRAQKVKRESSPPASALASGLLVNSDGVIDLTLD